MRFYRFSVYVYVCFALVQLKAQESQMVNPELKSGYDMLSKGNIGESIIFFKEKLKKKPKNAELYYWLGRCYESTPYKDSSVYYYKKAFDMDFACMPDILYRLGRAYHSNLQFDEAEYHYDKYLGYVTQEHAKKIGSNVLTEKMRARQRITECQNAKLIYYHMYNHEIYLLDEKINTIFPEYAPYVSGDGKKMIFTTRWPSNWGTKKDVDNQYFEDIWISTKNSQGGWDAPINLGPNVNTPGHDAGIAISVDGKKVLLYKSDNGGDIYETTYNKGEWTSPVSIGKNINTKYKEASACISKDGKNLFFSSNKPDGYGGLDLYMSVLEKDGKWGEPVNLGTRINSELDEDSPFLSPDGSTLYFSSNGHNTMGGYDIFVSNFNSKTQKWSDPINIGYPINSPDDDIYFSLSDDGKHAYFASARKGGIGDKDIYYIALDTLFQNRALVSSSDGITVSHFVKSKPLSGPTSISSTTSSASNNAQNKAKSADIGEFGTGKKISYKVKVMDNSSKKPLECQVLMHQLHTSKKTVSLQTNSRGELLVQIPVGFDYSVDVSKEGYIFYSSLLHLPQDIKRTEIMEEIWLHKPKKGERFTLRNIFFESGESILDPESYEELDYLVDFLLKNSHIKLEVSGHTDNRGSLKLNQQLSENRAKTITEYLISRGIAKERLVSKGYGADRPVATNETEEGRKLNRRTEFEIVE